ncbi:hypothetical protein DHEL01_v206390 [Diaporthe helianthi]|uniref:Phosphoribosylaminoimidazole-succinocarboxamide synthase n=1 Tax=Diaporthe helianthi TaxID=158607 RepID=A0A2P5HY92_DIAHE|nr:hypothetical protein DHEL01_v206390 [Diaporthe helianthi]
MNFQNLNFDYVEPPPLEATRRYLTTAATSTSTRLPSTSRYHGPIDNAEHASLKQASLSPQPSLTSHALSLSSPVSHSSSEVYGPERLYGRPLVPHAMANQTGEPSQALPQPQYTPEQLRVIAEAQRRRSVPIVPIAGRPAEVFRDQLALEAARVTPGVDDTPYIQYALEAMTREQQGQSSPSSMISEGQRLVPDRGLGYYPHQNAPSTLQPASSRSRNLTGQNEEQSAPLLAPAPELTPASQRSSLSTLVRGNNANVTAPPAQSSPEAWRPIEPELMTDGRERINPKLVFKPSSLRPASMITLLILCIAMTGAVLFCAIYSARSAGLWQYSGSIYNGQYFLFRVFPAILGAGILFHAQAIATTMMRMRPFARLASAQKKGRQDALFDELYPTSFLRPQLAGTWDVRVPMLITWVMNFTLPLQSCLFTVIYVDGHWRWATVQGVAWTLVALYILLAAAVVIELSCWLKGKTGVMWDPRSIADVIAIVSQSDTLAEYKGTETMGSRDAMKHVLQDRRFDLLAYWTSAEHSKHHDLWYALGSGSYQDAWGSPALFRETFGEKGTAQNHEKLTTAERKDQRRSFLWDGIQYFSPDLPTVRYRYIPLCLMNLTLAFSIGLGLVIVLAVLVVSFLPNTGITNGFLPRLSAAPMEGAFSAADFLYSFIPALLGLILFMFFQDIDLNMRVLQPWGELSNPPAGGALPEASILADYACCYPFQGAWHALRNGHWRLAYISLFSTLFVFLPIFAGGMFMALTPEDNIVRMFPQIPLFALTLALLVLYWLALVISYPSRNQFRLPHKVTCLAEIISFVANDDLMGDEAFQGMIRNKTTLVGKLGVDRRDDVKPRWVFSVGGAGVRDDRLSVRKVRKYTEPRASRGESSRLMSPRGAGAPSLGTGTLSSRREARRAERDVRISPQYVFAGNN